MKIIFVITISFLVAFGIFYGIMEWYSLNYDSTTQWVEYIKENPDLYNSPKILILGSSNISALNTTLIENILLTNGHNYDVYNLAIGSDFPSRRVNTVNQLVSLNPDLIVYGLEPRMFEKSPTQNSKISQLNDSDTNEFIPKIDELILNNLDSIFVNDFVSKIPKSPKLITLLSIKKIVFDGNITDIDVTIQRPFYNIENEKTDVKLQIDQEISWKKEKNIFNGMGKISNNFEYITLLEIEEYFLKNNIKTIVFATPKNDVYLNWIPSTELSNFDLIFTNLDNLGVTAYSDYDKYRNFEIFYDPTHIVENEIGDVYSYDFAKKLLMELAS